VWIGVVALMALTRLIGAFESHPSPSAVAPPPYSTGSSYASADADLDLYLDRATGGAMNLARLADRNPSLHDALVERWTDAHDQDQTRAFFDFDIRRMIDSAIGEALRGGSYDLQAAYWRLRVEELRQWQTTDAEVCAGVRPEPARVGPIDPRMGAVNARALTEPPLHPSPPLARGAVNRYTIPGAVVERAQRISHLDDATLSAAFLGRGTSAARCAARIALIEAALAVPQRDGARLVRDMSRSL
jgi:hypothetical protein